MEMGRSMVLVAAVLVSGFAVPSSSLGKGNVDSWNDRIQESVRLLRLGEASQARAIIAPVLEEMTRSVNPSKGSARAFGLALMLRGLAEAGEGHEREATWDWHLAQQIDPSLERWDLHEFGAAGAVLDRHRLARDPVPPTPEGDAREKAGGAKPEAILPEPKWSGVDSTRARRWKSPIVIGARVDEQGIPTYPRIVRKPAELDMVLVASEHLRARRFVAPQWEGKPVAFMYSFRLEYKP